VSAHAVIVAAGSGSRFGKPKQLELLGGIPLFLHSVLAFSSSKKIEKVVLVIPSDIENEIRSSLPDKYSNIIITYGGERRQDSVMNGLTALAGKDDDIVLVHDAARPLISYKVIEDVIEAAEKHGAALAAVPVVDTLKREDNGVAAETVNREHLWRAQTPQAARILSLRKALENAQNKELTGTDEAQLLAEISVRSYIVPSEERNFKVTYADDLVRAEALLR
jgi:2-C-methyl-D-erythritol 4-phosphate cytidylyltransferase